MSKFLLNLLPISKALVNSKIQFFNSEILFLDFSSASSLIFQPNRGPPPPSLSGLLHLSDSAVTSLSLLVRFRRRLPLADRWAHPVSEPGVVTLSDNARAHPRRHRSLATERHPAPRLTCPRTVTTSPSFSLP
jgi:hypothetical protein